MLGVDVMEKHEIEFGKNTIEFNLKRKNVKNINLNVRPDMTVVISANKNVPLQFILDFVKEKAPWIIKNLQHFKKTQPEVIHREKEFVSGESFRYLGKQYRLKVEESNEEYIKCIRGFIFLYVKDKNDEQRKQKLFNKWIRNRANIVFNESLNKMYPLIEKYRISKPKINIRQMKARWGTCIIDSNKIILNFDLIKAPKYCIDYVVLHELIHFKYRNHDDEFYSFLTALMPDWKQRKKILDEEIVRIL